MNSYYLANGWAKFYEEDIYEEGCQPDTGGMIHGREQFKAETLDGLLNEILAFTGGDREEIDIDACDEIGRVDVFLLENADGCPATKSEIESWKQADIQLWNCIYTFQIERIQAEPVNLHEEMTA